MFRAEGIETLSYDLGKAAAKAVPEVRKVLAKGALNIKDDTKANLSDHPSWKRLAPTVGYDFIGLGGVAGLSVEVGYEDRGQGELAGIYEFGSARRAGHPTLIPALERERPRFVKAMGDVLDGLL